MFLQFTLAKKARIRCEGITTEENQATYYIKKPTTSREFAF